MKIFVTGNLGFIGRVMVDVLLEKGYEVTGCDTGYFSGHDFFPSSRSLDNQLLKDVRDVTCDDLKGHHAVIHLAGLSNDPAGDINPSLTTIINGDATVRLAQLAKEAGVERFLFSSSCSVYGETPGKMMNEDSPFNPVSVYAQEKIIAEWRLSRLADPKSFAPVYMRNATAFGVSPRMRFDLVVNNMAGYAFTTGNVVMKTDGSSWRPNVHIRDISRAFMFALEAPFDVVYNRAFNVGANAQNHLVREIAEIVAKEFRREIVIAGKDSKDKRSYNVDFSRVRDELGFATEWSVARGAEELHDAFIKVGLTKPDFENPRYITLEWIKQLIQTSKIDADLRWRNNYGK